jgi:transposase
MKEAGEIIYLRAENAALKAENAEFRQTILGLTEKVNFLLTLLAPTTEGSIKKDSHNSSLPPSSDLFVSPLKKTQSLRPPSLLKSGGQLGHSGKTLEMRPTPDEVIDLKSTFCSRCGTSLSTTEATVFSLLARRQVVEIPPILPIYREYRQFCCTCPTCQHEQSPAFPLNITAPIQYGSSVESLLSYLSVYQYVPYERLQHLFANVFSLPLSQGTIANIIERVADKCSDFYDDIKAQILESQVVGSDETGAKVNGEKSWIWVWQNTTNTFIVPSDNRSGKTIDQVFENGLPQATLVSDRWRAQLNTKTKANQICLAHLKREAIYLEEAEKHPFATQFNQFITQIFGIKAEQVKKQQAFEQGQSTAQIIEQRLNELLAITITDKKDKKTKALQNSMIKHRNNILPCLYNLDIPPDNNGSERAIRMIKVKQKISGQFKSGQTAFCTIRSVIDTIKKRGNEILKSLINILNYEAQF